jgi:hypothetical protein
VLGVAIGISFKRACGSLFLARGGSCGRDPLPAIGDALPSFLHYCQRHELKARDEAGQERYALGVGPCGDGLGVECNDRSQRLRTTVDQGKACAEERLRMTLDPMGPRVPCIMVHA